MTARRLLITTSVPSTLTAFLLPYAAHYRNRGWQVDAATNASSVHPIIEESFDAVHKLPWTRSPTNVHDNFIKAPRTLRRLVIDGGYDLVHAHDPIAAFVTRFALRRARVRSGFSVVYTAHGFHFYRGAPAMRYAIYRVAEELAAAWTDALIVINREDERSASRFAFIDKNRVHYMPGIGLDLRYYDLAAVNQREITDIRSELGLAEQDQLLLMIAEFNPGKRHIDAIRALAESGRKDVVLALAGTGPEMQRVRDQAADAGVLSQVRLLGYRRDIKGLIATAFATILPSEREGLPRAIMESLAMCKPVIATRIRGVTELVSEDTGFLVDPGDVSGLAQAIGHLATNQDLAVTMGARGRDRMRAFDIENLLALHDELYESLLNVTS